MNGREWRDRTPTGCPSCGRQWPAERLELVERVVRAEKRAVIAETKARVALAEFPRDELTHLATEVEEQRVTIERLNQRIAELNQRRTA